MILLLIGSTCEEYKKIMAAAQRVHVDVYRNVVDIVAVTIAMTCPLVDFVYTDCDLQEGVASTRRNSRNFVFTPDNCEELTREERNTWVSTSQNVRIFCAFNVSSLGKLLAAIALSVRRSLDKSGFKFFFCFAVLQS